MKTEEPQHYFELQYLLSLMGRGSQMYSSLKPLFWLNFGHHGAAHAA